MTRRRYYEIAPGVSVRIPTHPPRKCEVKDGEKQPVQPHGRHWWRENNKYQPPFTQARYTRP